MGNYNKAELDVGAAIDYVYGKFCFASALKRRWKVSDFKITSKVQNGRLLKKIESCGYASVAEFCRETGAPLYEVHNYINFRIAPIKNDGSFRRSVHGICASLDCLPEDIFSDEQMWMQVEKNYTEQYFREHEVFEALSGVDDSLHIEADRSDLERAVGNALSQLTDRERNIIAMRFGISGHGELTLEKVACHFGVTPGRIASLETRAIRKLRHPKRLAPLDGHLNDTSQKSLDNFRENGHSVN